MMVRVVVRGAFSVYVYSEGGAPHHLPHCNVRWSDDNVQVALPTLEILAGDSFPPQARQLVLDYLERICEEWNRLNPGRSIE